MRRYELSADARLDLLKIWNYLAEQASLDVADTIANELRDAMRQFARMPGIGHARTDLAAESLRFWPSTPT
jgi:plasmid stabilization system protein ParE